MYYLHWLGGHDLWCDWSLIATTSRTINHDWSYISSSPVVIARLHVPPIVESDCKWRSCEASPFGRATSRKWWCFRPLLCTLFRLNWVKQTPGDNEAKLMTKLSPEWVRTSYPVIRSPARYRWTRRPPAATSRNSLWLVELLIVRLLDTIITNDWWCDHARMLMRSHARMLMRSHAIGGTTM